MRYAENAKTEWESAEERRERLKQVATLSFHVQGLRASECGPEPLNPQRNTKYETLNSEPLLFVKPLSVK